MSCFYYYEEEKEGEKEEVRIVRYLELSYGE